MKVALPNPAPVSLSGRHILIIEDEMLIALALADMVSALGCTHVLVGRYGKALALATTEPFDAAILDMNLNGAASYPIAEALNSRGIPFVIATGYGLDGIEPAYRDRPMLPKPYLAEQVEVALLKALRRP